MDLEEDSVLIEREAQSRAGKTVPAPFSWALAVITGVARIVPPRHRVLPVLFMLALGAAYAAKKGGLW
jgi:hypothetical protein